MIEGKMVPGLSMRYCGDPCDPGAGLDLLLSLSLFLFLCVSLSVSVCLSFPLSV